MIYSISNNVITMEIVYGQTIREYIKLYPNTYSILVENVINIIKALIRAGVSHNDLNIDNLIIDKEGYMWVFDFGYAKEICQHDNDILQRNLDVFIISINEYLNELNLDHVIPEKCRYKWEYNEDGDYVLIKPDT